MSTDIIVLLDESGSMESMGNEPKQAMNNFINKQKEQQGDCLFDLYTFGGDIRHIYKNIPMVDVKEYKDFRPDGCTPLYDCIGHAIDAKLATERKNNVVLVIITDGQDNSSRLYNLAKIKEKIKEMETKNNWQVLFLAANQDAFASGASMNIHPDRSASYDQNKKGCLEGLMRQVSGHVCEYRVASQSARPKTDIRL